jgi:hypothetical protein
MKKLFEGLGAGLSDFGRRLAKDFAKALEKRALVRAQRVKLSLKPSASRRWLLERERTLHSIQQHGRFKIFRFAQYDSVFPTRPGFSRIGVAHGGLLTTRPGG